MTPRANSFEPAPATPRRAMTPARRKRIIAKTNGWCAYPGCENNTHLEIDHTIPLELGGPDDDLNCAALCGPHHLQKTLLDLKMIAKARRIRKRNDGTRTPRKQIQSPGFSKALRKRMNGKVERRAP